MRGVLWALIASGAVGCVVQSNPNVGRYSCADAGDCGEGFECRAQFEGGGRCFAAGQCTEQELCNGQDDTCDGRTDETFPDAGSSCLTTAQGVCAVGRLDCSTGAVVCTQTVRPSAELCNGLDDNCDGALDETFDLLTDNAHCGACGRACGAGTSCFQAQCHETACSDGVDNDSNGKLDCLDSSCFGFECQSMPVPASRCGVLGAPPDDAGVDAGSFDGGVAGGLPGCFRPEANCANGYDDDGDGRSDCADDDCNGQVCFSGTVCTNRLCPGPG